MSAFAKLHADHSVLLVLVQELSRLTAQRNPPCRLELYHVRTKLASSLIRHLMEEDWIIYPTLLKSPDQYIRDTARAIQLESGALADAFRAHMKRWTTDAIDNEWPTYRHETSNLLGALKRRITREDDTIYNLTAPGVADEPLKRAWG